DPYRLLIQHLRERRVHDDDLDGVLLPACAAAEHTHRMRHSIGVIHADIANAPLRRKASRHARVPRGARPIAGHGDVAGRHAHVAGKRDDRPELQWSQVLRRPLPSIDAPHDAVLLRIHELAELQAPVLDRATTPILYKVQEQPIVASPCPTIRLPIDVVLIGLGARQAGLERRERRWPPRARRSQKTVRLWHQNISDVYVSRSTNAIWCIPNL